MATKNIRSALISVFHKEGLEPVLQALHAQDIKLYSTGGTHRFIEEKGYPVTSVEEVTGYPSIFGGRVKTLHPKVFGGILYRRDEKEDNAEAEEYEIPDFDLVLVDLYPFERAVQEESEESNIIENIDIGGIALLRAAAKNFRDVLTISSRSQYEELINLLNTKNGATEPEDRRFYAAQAFNLTSHYDTAIFNYLNQNENIPAFKASEPKGHELRYGENPHQKGNFYGNLEEIFEKLNGKELSYNNLVDIEAAAGLTEEFPADKGASFVIVKHTNACGVATAGSALEAYEAALACDPVSAFGGIISSNTKIDKATAEKIQEIFFEVLIAPDFDNDALEVLTSKKNRIILKKKASIQVKKQFKSLLNGVLEQDADLNTEEKEDIQQATERQASEEEIQAMLFANKIVKHTKSNAIVLAKKDQLLASGVGQTSRVDALNQAIDKAKHFGFDLSNSVMASDAFFPFPDCVEIAQKYGVTAVIQPGGSKKDQESVDFCNQHNMAMITTGIRHFKH